MIEYAEESFEAVLPELALLHTQQWEETENYRKALEFNPNYAAAAKYAALGIYRIFTVRRGGMLVGHLSLYVTESMHTQTKLAQEDSLFLQKDARGVGRTALRLLQFAEAKLQSEGVREIYCSVKKGAGSKGLLIKMNYQHVSDGFHKLL